MNSKSVFNAPEIPFPIEVPFSIRADMSKLGSSLHGRIETDHFRLDTDFLKYQSQKLELLESRVERCRCLQTNDPNGLRIALKRTRDLFASEHPRLAPNIPESATLEEFADALALVMQEDFVIVQNSLEARAELIHVCFPSRWDPREKIGQGFAEVHVPVADSAALVKASQNVAKAMVTRGPFVRFVWALTADPSLDQHPEHPRLNPEDQLSPDEVASRTFMRVERQTTFPMPDLERALFTIRVYMQPLTEAANTPESRAHLAASLRSMKPEVIVYKGFQRLYDPVLTWLEDQ